MSILQNTLFDYNTALSQFLEARRNQHSSLSLGFYPVANSTATTSGSDTAESSSPSPPAISAIPTIRANINNNNSNINNNNNTGKSFTIDAILGLRCKSNNNNDNRHTSNAVLDYSSASSSRKNSNSNGSVKRDDDLLSDGAKVGGKSKRVRTIFTPEQLERLEAEFERQQYMVGPERLYLAHTLQLTEAQVKVWFQNRRIKWRKQHLEMTQQRLALLKQHREQKLQRQQQTQLLQINSNNAELDEMSSSTGGNEHNFSLHQPI